MSELVAGAPGLGKVTLWVCAHRSTWARTGDTKGEAPASSQKRSTRSSKERESSKGSLDKRMWEKMGCHYVMAGSFEIPKRISVWA